MILKKANKFGEDIKTLLKDDKSNDQAKKLIGLTNLISCCCLNLPYQPDLQDTVEEIGIAIDDYQKSFMRSQEEQQVEDEGIEHNEKKRKLNNLKAKIVKKNSQDKDYKCVQILNDIMISLLTRSSGN